MKFSRVFAVVALAACGGSGAARNASPPAPTASPSSSTTPPPPTPHGTLVARPKLKGGERGTARVELDCDWERSSQKQPKARKVEAPNFRADLEWNVDADRRFTIVAKRFVTKPAKLPSEFASLAKADGGTFEGRLDADGQGRATPAYGSERLYNDDVLELLDSLSDVVAYALYMHLPEGPVAEGEEWNYRGRSRCGGPMCVDTTKSKLAPPHDGHVVVETTYRYETADHEYDIAKVPVWWGETKVVREIIPGLLLTDTTVERATRLELESPKAWRKSRTHCRATLKGTPASQ